MCDLLTIFPVLVSFWPALHWASLPPQSLDCIILGWAIANIAKSFPLCGPGSAVSELPDYATIVAVIYSCKVPDYWPHPGVQYPLIIELIQVRLDTQQCC